MGAGFVEEMRDSVSCEENEGNHTGDSHRHPSWIVLMSGRQVLNEYIYKVNLGGVQCAG